jgi:DNA-binding NarL/FixJ family response regulator
MPVKISIVEGGGALHGKLAPFLAKSGNEYRFSIYPTGEKALRGISTERPDVALVNFHLPVMDGFECVRKLKAVLPPMPVLMFTTDLETESPKGRLENELIFSAAHAGANGYLPKDLSPFEMANAIEQVCEGARRHCRTFLMFFNSDRSLGQTAQYWGKIATMISAPSANISYGWRWRTVTLVGRMDNIQRPGPMPRTDFDAPRQMFSAPFRSQGF